jgi:hypothetical protein
MTRTDQMELFRTKCDELGKAEVARRTGYSPPTISQLYNAAYGADPSAILQRVEEVFASDKSVACPMLGPITPGKCAEQRRRPYAATNPQRVRMFRACKACSQGGK